MSFLERVRDRARAVRRRIVFPESADPRTLAAVAELARDGIVEPVLILDPDDLPSHAAARDTGVETLDPRDDPRRERAEADLIERRGHKGLTTADARRLSLTPFAARVEGRTRPGRQPELTGPRAASWCDASPSAPP